jgi:hypothetical protein
LESESDARVAHACELSEKEYSLVLNEIKLPGPFRFGELNFYRDIERGFSNET